MDNKKPHQVPNQIATRIVVSGYVPESWNERLSGMAITRCKSIDGNSTSTLVGLLRDDAELNGVLESLYALQLSIIKLERINLEKP
jgi:hypothetical protein